MYDQSLLLQTLSRFAVILPARYDLQETLSELTESATAVLGLCGAWVTMAHDGQLTAVSQDSAELQRDHAQLHPFPCPCRDAYATGEVIRVTDIREKITHWPEFAASATRLSIAGVAAIPMRLADQIIGALNLYSPEPRQWSDEDMAVAMLLADVATSYVVNASKLHQQEQLSEQLQEALESRVVIEQAKGITAQQRSVTPDQAFQLMRSHARNNNTSLRAVAKAIVSVGLHV
ncbi:MAG TPA: GAF and ANTAR domain-containing protein [Dermatophilaceae bacterium]|nr:GAF and ANTAR domain-containing protein [Dermatophilaceae bacterium]